MTLWEEIRCSSLLGIKELIALSDKRIFQVEVKNLYYKIIKIHLTFRLGVEKVPLY